MPHDVPDYDLAPTLPVAGDVVHKAFGDPRRRRILSLLSERAATARQLSVAIDRSAPTTTHHLDVLHEAGLVRVVRTRKVRATEERWWGRTARVFILSGDDRQGDVVGAMIDEARAEADAARRAGIAHPEGLGTGSTLRYARIPAERAEAWFERLAALADEFSSQPRDGDVVHGMLVTVFPTAWRPLGDDADRPPRRDTRPPHDEGRG